jgi:hypothetical protein
MIETVLEFLFCSFGTGAINSKLLKNSEKPVLDLVIKRADNGTS